MPVVSGLITKARSVALVPLYTLYAVAPVTAFQFRFTCVELGVTIKPVGVAGADSGGGGGEGVPIFTVTESLATMLLFPPVHIILNSVF